MYKTSDLNSAIEELGKQCELAAITIGKNGSIIVSNGKKTNIDPFIFGKAIDTTGAGDLYAGGFLKGISDGLSPSISAKIGLALTNKTEFAVEINENDGTITSSLSLILYDNKLACKADVPEFIATQ